MASPSTSPPRRRALVVAGLTVTALVASVVPAFAHAQFPSGQNPTGTVANPYAAASVQTITIGADNIESQSGLNTNDLKVRVPTGWTAPACGNVSETAAGATQPGWTCAISTVGSNQVIHWQGPGGAMSSDDLFFRFTVTTPSPTATTTYGNGAPGTGNQGFRITQSYADGQSDVWATSNEPGTVKDYVFSLQRTVSATPSPSPSPSPSPDPSPSPSPSPSPDPSPSPSPSPGPGPGTLLGEQAISASVPATAQEFSISFAATPVTLAAGTSTATYHPFTGSLNAITLKDTRTAAPSWAVAGQAGDFTGLANSARYLGWTPAVATPGAGAVVGAPVTGALDAQPGPGLTTSKGLAGAPAAHALGTAVLGADLDLKLPTGIPGGSYSSTLTITAI